jgi:hypothetical protein
MRNRCHGNVFTEPLPGNGLHNTVVYSPVSQQWLYTPQYINTIINLLVIFHRAVFNDVSETGISLRPEITNLLSWVHLIELVPISGQKQNQHNAGYMKQKRHKPPAGDKRF